MKLRLMTLSRCLPDLYPAYEDEDCNPVSYVGNLNRLLGELPPLNDQQRYSVIAAADTMGLELKKVLKCW